MFLTELKKKPFTLVKGFFCDLGSIKMDFAVKVVVKMSHSQDVFNKTKCFIYEIIIKVQKEN